MCERGVPSHRQRRPRLLPAACSSGGQAIGLSALREEGIGSDPVFANVHRQLAEAGVEFETPFDVVEEAGSGLSDRMMHKVEGDASVVLLPAKEALARGNINFIRYELNELLQLFRINLEPACADYRKVALGEIRTSLLKHSDIKRFSLQFSPRDKSRGRAERCLWVNVFRQDSRATG